MGSKYLGVDYYDTQMNLYNLIFQMVELLSSSLGNRSMAGSYIMYRSWQIVLGYFLYIESIDILIPMFIGGFFMTIDGSYRYNTW